MIIEQEINKAIKSQGVQQTSGFNIKTNAHAFQMLSSGLYSDKVRAVLREIGCNAMDAHIDAGKPNLPIEVKLPTSLDPQFYIKDFGKGLSHEDVTGMYTTYFESNKQQSATQTGGFGLGSKSPFSYTDSFHVVSAHNGEQRTYALYIGEEGSPTVSLMSTTKADPAWPSGMRVGFPVKPGDHAEFRTKAQMVFQWFDVKPNIIGTKLEAVELKHEVDGVWKRKTVTGYGNTDFIAIMTNVAYPVKLASVYKGPGLSYLEIFSQSLVLKVPNSSLKIAGSREELQYTQQTITTISSILMKLVAAFKKKMSDIISTDIDSYDTYVELRKKLNDEFEGAGINGYHMGSVLASLGLPQALVDKANKLQQGSGARVTLPNDVNVAVCRNDGKGPSRTSKSYLYVPVVPKACIVVGDTNRSLARARLAVYDKKYEHIVVISPKEDGAVLDAETAAEAISKEVFLMPVVMASTLPAPPIVRRPPGSPKIKRVPAIQTRMFSRHILNSIEDRTTISNIAADHKYYVIRKQWSRWGRQSSEIVVPGGTRTTQGLIENLCSVADLSNDLPKGYIYLSEAEEKKFGPDLTAMGFAPLLPEVKKILENPATLKGSGVKRYIRPYGSHTFADWLIELYQNKTNDAHAILSELPLVPDTIDHIRALSKIKVSDPYRATPTDEFRALCSVFGATFTTLDKATTPEDVSRSIWTAYPAMEHANLEQFRALHSFNPAKALQYTRIFTS